MELLFAALAGLAVGAVMGLLARHRDLLGPGLAAMIGGIAAIVVWEAATWLGALPGFDWLRYDRAWIWWITILLAAAISFWAASALGSGRAKRDADLLDRLSHVGRIRKGKGRTASAGAASSTSAAEDGGAAAGGATAAPAADEIADADALDNDLASAAEPDRDDADGDAVVDGSADGSAAEDRPADAEVADGGLTAGDLPEADALDRSAASGRP